MTLEDMVFSIKRITDRVFIALILTVLVLVFSGCGLRDEAESGADSEKLKVVATTTFLGDVLREIAGDQIDLIVLLEPGQNPHSYQPTPQDLVNVSDADLIFANGLGLEEFLDDLLTGAENHAALVLTSENISPLQFDGDDQAHEEGEDNYEEGDLEDHEGEEHFEEDGHQHLGQDPHVWFDPHNVILWVEVISEHLAGADPAQADLYRQNADNYQDRLAELDRWIQEQISSVPEENRELVTDHTTFVYFAERYGFEQIGAVIPASTTEVETSGQQLAALLDTIQDHNVKAIFVSVDIDSALAERVAEDTGVDLVPLYLGSLSEGDPAGTYLDFMRYNVKTIVEALK